jgi:hypothetical protein
MKYNLFCKLAGPQRATSSRPFGSGLEIFKNSNKDYYALTVVFNKTNEDI